MLPSTSVALIAPTLTGHCAVLEQAHANRARRAPDHCAPATRSGLGIATGSKRRAGRRRAPRAESRSRRAPSPARAGCRRESPPPGPASTGSPAALAVHAQSRRVARAAADDVQLGAAPRRSRSRSTSIGRGVLEREALEHAAHDRAGRLPGSGWPVCAAERAESAPACRPARGTAPRRDRRTPANGGASAAERDELVEGELAPLARPSGAGTRRSSHSPLRMLPGPNAPAMPPSLVRLAAKVASSMARRRQAPRSPAPPGPGADVGRARRPEGHPAATADPGGVAVTCHCHRPGARPRPVSCTPPPRHRPSYGCRAAPPPESTRSGMPRPPRRSRAQSRVRGSRHCVVVALVNSVARVPQSRWCSRSRHQQERLGRGQRRGRRRRPRPRPARTGCRWA